jgi:hypothetical protein
MNDYFKAVLSYANEHGMDINFLQYEEIEGFLNMQDSDNQLHCTNLGIKDIKRSVEAIKILREIGWRIE